MAVLFRTCCCGCNLRTGIFLIGLFGLLAASCGVYTSIYTAKLISDLDFDDDIDDDTPVADTYGKAVINLSYASLAFNVVVLLTNIGLLISFCTMNRFLALPYIIVHIFMLAFTLGVTIFFIAIWNGFSYVFTGSILGWLLYIYFILVVYSYHEALREDPSGTTAGFPGPVPMVIAGFPGPVPMVQAIGGPPPNAYAKFP